MTRYSMAVLALGLALFAVGCKKKGPTDPKGSAGGPVASGARELPRSYTFGTLSISARVPAGWKETKFGSNAVRIVAPGKSLYVSSLMIGTSCQGSCNKIPENLTKVASEQVRRHGKSFAELKLVQDAALPGGGRQFLLSFKHHGKPAYQYESYQWKPGWPHAAMCRAMLFFDDAARLADFQRMCDGIVVKKK